MRSSIGTTLVVVATTTTSFAQSWEGFYTGPNLGVSWSATRTAFGSDGTLSASGNGAAGGGQAGYNHMIGGLLLGGEADFQGSTASSSASGPIGPMSVNATATTPWFSTLRGRIGYPVGMALPYLTGGAVYGQEKLEGSTSALGSFGKSANFWSYAYGAGVESHVTDRWSAKLEYLRIGEPDTALLPPGATGVDDRSVGNLLRLGINYHF